MNNNVLLSLAMSIIPMLAIGFVILLVIYKIYIKIRSRFNISVNCWFCNQNTKVPYLEANCWTCPSCEQYNGFNKDGDYNRQIYEQLDSSRNSERFNVAQQQPLELQRQQLLQNGFCEACNEAQRLKVEKLAQFEPKNESKWDQELKVYKAKLEEEHRLCSTCDRHLNKVLREKKKMVLGSKFLDFIIKGAEKLKQPHLDNIEHAKQEQRKQKLRKLITILAFVNICCLIGSLSTLNKDIFTKFLGISLGHQIFLISSHFIAFIKVMGTYFDIIQKHAVVNKIILFSRTIFMMIMYSMGLKVSHIDFSTMFISFCPFALLCLSFMHNIVDSFRLNRFTGLLVIWSLFAGGLIDHTWTLTPQMLMLFTSLITFVIALTSKPEPSPKLHDSTANSFHKIYSEDYLSDEDTMSILSQQLDSSCVSRHSMRSNESFRSPSPLIQRKSSSNITRWPLTASALSLKQTPLAQISPNSNFSNYAVQESPDLRPMFATPMPMPINNRQSFHASNLDLHNKQRPQSTMFGMNASVANLNMFNNSFTEPSRTCFVNHTQDNDASFYTAVNNSNTGSMLNNKNCFTVTGGKPVGMHSPFSVSSNAIYHHPQRNELRPNNHLNLISPTMFSTNNLTSSNASWLSGGYFNQRQSMTEIPRNGLVIPRPTQTLATPMEESLSRSSSHSSGFESQNGRLNGNTSRENSLCPDLNTDHHQRTLTTDNGNSFQPIDSPCLGLFSPRLPPLSSQNSLYNFPNDNLQIRKQTIFTRPSNFNNNLFSKTSIDSFNLRRINEELPSINRGDLLKK